MIENLPLQSVKYKGLTIEGYSRAAVQSYWRIPELKLGFDMGASPWSFMGTGVFFISHAHLDHMAALPAYVARRRMMKMNPPTIYMPAEVIDPVWNMLKSWQKLDRGRMECDLVGLKDGEEVQLSREHAVTAFQTKHTVPSLGFQVWDCRKKLKPEFVNKPESEIRDSRISGIEVSEEIRVPLVCYTGDTAPAGLDHFKTAYESKVLITEMTFYRPDHRREKIHKYGHMHLDDLVERAEQFQNELIILAHFSTRYHDNQVMNAIKKRLPAELQERIHLWM